MRKSIPMYVMAVLTVLVTAVPIHASADMTFTPPEVQKGLQQNVEQFYYTYKDKPVKKPEHNVSGVKVLHYTTHEQLAILVGSCLIDGKENLITGSLYKDPKTQKIHFGGGWMERARINKPLYWGMGGNGTGIVLSGLAIDKSITQIQVSSMDDEQAFTVPVSDKGYFAAWVPIKRRPGAPRGLRVWIEGLDKNGNVVYSLREPQTREDKSGTLSNKSPSTSGKRFYMSIRLTEPSAVSSVNNTFHPKGTCFSPNIEIKNGLPNTNTYLITFFDNGKQIPVTYQHHAVTSINLSVQPWSSSKFSVNISNLKPGVHYIDCVSIRQPFSTSNTFDPPQKSVVPRRMVVTIGSASDTTSGTKAVNISQNINSPKRAMNLPYFTTQPMGVLADAVSSSNGDKLYLNFRPKQSGIDYSVMILLDYKQVVNAVPYDFFHAQSNGLISMPVKLPVLKGGQKHILMALVVPNPFKSIETPSGELVPPNERFPWVVFATNKVSVTN